MSEYDLSNAARRIANGLARKRPLDFARQLLMVDQCGTPAYSVPPDGTVVYLDEQGEPKLFPEQPGREEGCLFLPRQSVTVPEIPCKCGATLSPKVRHSLVRQAVMMLNGMVAESACKLVKHSMDLGHLPTSPFTLSNLCAALLRSLSSDYPVSRVLLSNSEAKCLPLVSIATWMKAFGKTNASFASPSKKREEAGCVLCITINGHRIDLVDAGAPCPALLAPQEDYIGVMNVTGASYYTIYGEGDKRGLGFDYSMMLMQPGALIALV